MQVFRLATSSRPTVSLMRSVMGTSNKIKGIQKTIKLCIFNNLACPSRQIRANKQHSECFALRQRASKDVPQVSSRRNPRVLKCHARSGKDKHKEACSISYLEIGMKLLAEHVSVDPKKQLQKQFYIAFLEKM